jgi:hypothetical protein
MKAIRDEYNGHRIELRQRKGERELLIDNQVIRYGELPGGLFFLYDYAYDWRPDLQDLARRYIDYRSATTNA